MGVPRVTMVIRERCLSCSVSETVSDSMLYPRPENSPITRASTPGSLSTSTDNVRGSMVSVLSIGSHHHLAFFGDGVLRVDAGIAEQHLVMRTSRRDHREAVLRRIDDAIENHRLGRVDHLADGVIEVAGPFAADADRMIGLRQLHEIRQGMHVALGITAAVQQLLP